MPQLSQLSQICKQAGLLVSAVAPLTKDDGFSPTYRSVALLSPDPHAFWSIFSASPERNDGLDHPIDRWSQRTIEALAKQVRASAIFPFQGPPYHPFSSWAQRAGVAWQSPSGLLVHSVYGMWISFRGAVVLEEDAPLEPATVSPCETCTRPCLQSCPVEAISDDGFEYQTCRDHVQSAAGAACAASGCVARRACPVGKDFAPPNEQLQLHMKAFAR